MCKGNVVLNPQRFYPAPKYDINPSDAQVDMKPFSSYPSLFILLILFKYFDVVWNKK